MVKIAELPTVDTKGLFFTLKDVNYSPSVPKMGEPFIIEGKVQLLKIPYFPPCWIIATVTAPEKWYEHYIPIWGAPEIRETVMATGGDFKITFPRGFDREGVYELAVRVYPGPTMPLDSVTLPPVPAVATIEKTFTVSGETPPEDAGLRNFRIVSYSKNGGTPAISPDVLELDVGDRCRIKLAGEHKDGAVSGRYHVAIWQARPLDPHDEVLNVENSFSLPASSDWKPFEEYIEIPITSNISLGEGYGLYAKIMGITGNDIFTGYLPNVITIAGVTEGKFRNLRITAFDKEIDVGGTCHVAVGFDYQGPRLTGKQIYAAIGNNGWAGFDEILHGTATITSIPESSTWKTYQASMDIYISPSIDPNDSPYDIYAKLGGTLPETQSPILENVITIRGAVGEMWAIVEEYTTGGHLESSPSPKRMEGGKWYYDRGIRVSLTAVPDTPYKWTKWEGEVANTNINPTYMIMDQNRGDWAKKIRANYEREVTTGFSLVISKSPADIQYSVSKSPSKTTYGSGEYVSLTASPAASFDHWEGDASGGSPSTTILMNSDKYVIAVFKEAVPEVGSFSIVATGFPPFTKYWSLFFIPEGEPYKCPTIGCSQWIGVNDAFSFNQVKLRGHLACFCYSYYGDTSDQYNSEFFYAADGARFEYDIASGDIRRLY